MSQHKPLIDDSQAITITPFETKYQDEAKALILAGLEEHWGTLDLSMNPDLNDIGETYADAYFLVALQKGKLIGTGALIPRSDDVAEIARMSVNTQLRRLGIGKRILRELCLYAKSNGYKQIILETTETWLEVIEFYKRFGFQITHYQDGDVYFALDLSNFA